MAKEIGAANTLVFAGGQIQAHNTDAGGVLAALPVAPRGLRALVLGAGGAARAAVWALGTAGAEVDIWNRTPARAEAIRIELEGDVRVRIEVKSTAGPAPTLDQSGYGLIVNTTTVGLHGEDPFAHLPLRRDGFAPGQTVLDMVYGDSASTLLAAAADSGATVVDGLEALVQQGALSLKIWTGRDAPLDAMRAAARA
jgi:shikimate dehydrogenase